MGDFNRRGTPVSKIMSYDRYNMNNWDGNDNKGYTNTDWWLDSSDGWNIISPTKIEFTPNIDLNRRWDTSNSIWLEDYDSVHYQFFDTRVADKGSQIIIRRKYPVQNPNPDSIIIYNWLESLIAERLVSTSKQDLISKFNNKLKSAIEEFSNSLPSTKSKTVPYVIDNVTTSSQDTEWYTTSQKTDRIYLSMTESRRLNIQSSDGMGKEQERRFNIWINSRCSYTQ